MDKEMKVVLLHFAILLVFSSGGAWAARDRSGPEYYGVFIGSMNSFAHKVSGKVYAVDDDTIFIKGFTYDGLGPDAYFWVGKTSQPSPTGTIVPYPVEYSGGNREAPVLSNYQSEDILLHLPDGQKIKDFKWLSVWCRRFTVNFGDVYIPPELKPPARKILPEFKRLAHGLRSGNITILDSKTFYIPNLHYDGAGPDAYFFVGKGPHPHSTGRKIPNERGSTEVLQGYEGEDIELTLPSNLTVMDIDWLSVWCIRYKHNFGHVMIPKDLNVPPALTQFKNRVKGELNNPWPIFVSTTQAPRLITDQPAKDKEFTNCREFLDRNIQVKWNAVDRFIHFEVSARIPETHYVALGFSPLKGITQMVGADAIVMYHTPKGRVKFHADDYFMSAKSQCDGMQGVCPDSRISGKNDVTLLDGERKNGITTITFKRPFVTSESGKYDIALDNEVNIMVALGLLNNRKEANFHYGERTSASDDERILLRSRGDHNCVGDLSPASEPDIEAWEPAIIDGVSNFTARIGPTGGKRGYLAITGQPSWGIAWYMNERLIPEIYVERGKTYYFEIEGGNDHTQAARYHPFYITSSPEGGYGQKTESERSQQKIFAGVGYDTQGHPYPSAVGRYCEYKHHSTDKSKESATFEKYMSTLYLDCEDGEPGKLAWTVDVNTPDIVYYQCYTHNNLGWKIHVNDAGYRLKRTSSGDTRMASVFSVIIGLFCSFLYVFQSERI